MILLILLCNLQLHSNTSEFLRYYRSSDWNSLIQFFNQKEKKELSQEEKYIFAKAFENEKKEKNLDETISLYLISSGINCNKPFLSCIQSYGPVKGYISNLAFYHLQKILKEDPLRWEILLRADYSLDSPVSRYLYVELLKEIYNRFDNFSNSDKNYFVAKYLEKIRLESPLIFLFKARIFRKINMLETAQYFYFLSASKTKNKGLLNSIANDLEKEITFQQISPQNIRKMTFFYFSPSAKEILKKFSESQILQTTNSELVFYDGMYFIESDNYNALLKLANQSYSFISQNPEILTIWIQELNLKKQYFVVYNLMGILPHVKKYYQKLWINYLTSLEEIYKTDYSFKNIYFNEILDYLNVFHYSIDVYDKLINFLIKREKNNIIWEEKKYWDSAYQKLTNQTEAGRFYYWYYRYNKDFLKDQVTAKYIADNFYSLAPGNYYIHYFWDIHNKNKNLNYKNDWQKVFSRKDYKKWISRYGGNREAIEFLSKQNIYHFYDPKALEIQSFLNEIIKNPNYYYIDEEIIFYAKYGEYQFAFELLKQKYKDKLTNIKFLKYLIFTGILSENLFIEVRNLRKLLWELNISEDPFSLPPIVLKRLYPKPYYNIVRNYSKVYNISEDIIYALMRQESMFREDAISPSGAIGLMQIMPATGKWLAKKMGLKEYNLLFPETSIKLGAKFFSALLRNYQQNFHMASIAYNGGGGNLARWMRYHYKGDFYLFLEDLPVRESRNYCRKTYQNYIHYQVSQRLYDYRKR